MVTKHDLEGRIKKKIYTNLKLRNEEGIMNNNESSCRDNDSDLFDSLEGFEDDFNQRDF